MHGKSIDFKAPLIVLYMDYSNLERFAVNNNYLECQFVCLDKAQNNIYYF